MISIIVPAYNSESTVARVIGSILNQSYVNWELLIINDGSKDKTEEICSSYTKKDKRIKLYNQENKGVSAARNLGIKKAEGDFIIFVDSDDELKNTYLNELLHDYYECGLPDIVMQSYTHVRNDLENLEVDTAIQINGVYDLPQNNNFFSDINIMLIGQPFGKLFSFDIIRKNELFFKENITIGEDLIFLLEYLTFCNKIKVSNKSNYFYFHYNNSLSNTIHLFHDEYEAYRLILINYRKLLKINRFDHDQINKNFNNNYDQIIRPVISLALHEKVLDSYKQASVSIDNEFFSTLGFFFKKNKKLFMLSFFCNKFLWIFLVIFLKCKYKCKI